MAWVPNFCGEPFWIGVACDSFIMSFCARDTFASRAPRREYMEEGGATVNGQFQESPYHPPQFRTGHRSQIFEAKFRPAKA